MSTTKEALRIPAVPGAGVGTRATRPGRSKPRTRKPPGRSPSVKLPMVAEKKNAEVRARQLHAAMIAFRDGDFAVRLPTDWDGIDGRIAEAFNQALAYEDRITRELTRLSTAVGKEGRLRQRMSVPGAIGGWAEKVELLNSLLDDLVRPTTDVARTIGAVAKGDLGQSIELEVDGRPLKGEFLRSAKLFILLLDIGLPGMDGYELARRLRNDGFTSSLMVAIPGYAHESDIERSRAAGFDRHLAKPVDIDQLVNSLASG